LWNHRVTEVLESRVIRAVRGRLIDGIAETPMEDALLVIDGAIITYAGRYDSTRVPDNAEVVDIPGATILPGFIDCHIHFTGTESSDVHEMAQSHFDQLLRLAHDVGLLLEAGFTGARDISIFGEHLRKAIEAGLIRGPRIVPGGRMMSPTAGHGDFYADADVEWVNRHSTVCHLADGVDECLKGARMQFRGGARFVKVSATGGVSSAVDGVDDVQFSFDELRVIVEEAERHGTYVAAHCTGTAGTVQALKAGVKSIEHGVMLDQECVDLMVANDATLVTTLTVPLALPHMKDVLPPHMYEKGLKAAEAVVDSIQLARNAGVRIALGTDFSNSKNSPYTNLGKEFVSMVKAGLTPMEAIKAGTRNAAHLMLMEDSIGRLEPGKSADLVVVDGNPIDDISLLCGTDHIRVVMKDGAIEKDQRGLS